MTGAICIDKSSGTTSFNICRQLSKLYEEKKCGHTGTLDPLATGLMIVLFGGATRFAEFITSNDKHYCASFILGKTTDTYDITGNVTGQYEVNAETNDIENVLMHFKGEITQTPPMYSAVSVNGKRLYKLARAGISVEREERNVFIKSLNLIKTENGEFTIDVVCSKGTYIRSLIDDIGKEIGCGAVMTRLRRTGYSGLSIENAVTVERIKKEKENGQNITKYIFPVENLFNNEIVHISEKQSVRFMNGGALDAGRVKHNLQTGELYKIYSPEDTFLGIGEMSEGKLKVKRLLIDK